MRRKDQQVTDPRLINELLATATVCRLALVDAGEPYIVPVNYGFREGALYIHSAPVGRKIEALRRHPRVCFEIESPVTITRHAEPCHWGAKARSLIGYGHVQMITDDEEKRRGLDAIMAHYGKSDANHYDPKELAAVVILRIQIESLTCKQLGHWEDAVPPAPPDARYGHPANAPAASPPGA